MSGADQLLEAIARIGRILEGNGPRKRGGHAWDFLRFELAHTRDVPSAREAIERALEGAKADGDLAAELLYRHWRVQLWIHFDGDLTRSMPEALDLIAVIATRTPDHAKRICATVNLLQCQLEMDPTRFLVPSLPVADELIRGLPRDSNCRHCIRVAMAQAQIGCGSAATGLETLSRGMLELTGEAHEATAAHRAMALARTGDVRAAVRELTPAIEKARKTGLTIRAAELDLALGQSLALAGELEGCARILDELRRSQVPCAGDLFSLDLAVAEAELAQRRGDFETCFDTYRRVIGRLEVLGQDYRAARHAVRVLWIARDSTIAAACASRADESSMQEDARRLLRRVAQPSQLVKALRQEHAG